MWDNGFDNFQTTRPLEDNFSLFGDESKDDCLQDEFCEKWYFCFYGLTYYKSFL